MKYRIFSERFYSSVEDKSRLDTDFDYDTTGELDTERLFTQEPCFAHYAVKKTKQWKRKTIICSRGRTSPRVISAYMALVDAGFLVLRISNEKRLVPVVSEAQLRDVEYSGFFGRQIDVLLQPYQLHRNDCLIAEDDGLCIEFHLYDSLDVDFNVSYYIDVDVFCNDVLLRPGMLHIYTTSRNAIAYAICGRDGSVIHQTTNIPGWRFSHDKSDAVLRAYMVNLGHIDDLQGEEERELILDIKNRSITALALKKTLDRHPNIEVLRLTNLVIMDNLPDLALPKLTSLIVTADKYLDNKISCYNMRKLLQASKCLHTVKIHNSVHAPTSYSENLPCGPHIKILSVSADILRYVTLAPKPGLLGVEIVPARSVLGLEPWHERFDERALHALVQKCSALQLLDMSQIDFSRDSLYQNIPGNLKSFQEFYQNKSSSKDDLAPLTHRNPVVVRADIVQRVIDYISVSSKSKEKSILAQDGVIDLMLIRCFFYINSTIPGALPQGIQIAWQEYIACIHTWSVSRYVPRDSKISFIFTYLNHELSNNPNVYRCAILDLASLVELWRTIPEQTLSLCDGKQLVQIQFQSEFWYYFDLSQDIMQVQVFSQGNETSLQAELVQKFTDQALYITTLQPLRFEINRHVRAETVLAYIGKKHGLEYVLRSVDAEHLLAFIQIDRLQRDDFSPLLEDEFYKIALVLQPTFTRRMLERYQSLDSTFVMPVETVIPKDKYILRFEDTYEIPYRELSHSASSSNPNRITLTSSSQLSAPLTAKKRTPARQSQSLVYVSQPLSADLQDKQRWLRRAGATDMSQRLLQEKLQDYLVLQYGMTSAIWAVLNTIEEQDITPAIAYCFADYWVDTTADDPEFLIFGWKDACVALQYWQGEARDLPPADSKLYGMLHLLWYYSYQMCVGTTQSHPYIHRQTVQDLLVLLQSHPTQPLVFFNEKHAVTCLLRGGIWYLFNPKNVTAEPVYFRCGDELSLRSDIVANLTSDLCVATREPLIYGVGDRVTLVSRQEFPEVVAPELGDLRVFKQSGAKYAPNRQSSSSRLDNLFPQTDVVDASRVLHGDDPDLSFLCQCSLDMASIQPSVAESKKAQDSSIYTGSLTNFDLDVLGREGQNLLLRCVDEEHLSAYLDHLLTTSQAKSRGLWIVNSMRDMQCDVKNMRIYPDNHCEELPAPAGDCFQFLRTHAAPIIVVNVSALGKQGIVQINPLWDEGAHRSIDNIQIPERALVLSLQNIGDPDAYLGEDFTSRQDGDPIHVPEAVPSSDLLRPLLAAPSGAAGEVLELELYNSLHWKKYLYGKIDHAETGVLFEPTALLKHRAFTEPLQIVLHNAPTHLPEFRHALYTLCQNKVAQYHGLTTTLPSTLSLRLINGYQFEWLQTRPLFTRQYQDDYDYVLNPSTLAQFFVCYRFTEHGIVTLPGLIAKHADQRITLYVTRAIGIDDWSKFLHKLQEHRCHAHFILNEQVQLPYELGRCVSIIPNTSVSQSQLFPYVQDEGEDIDLQPYDRIISVTGLQANDIFYRVYRDKDKILREAITETWQLLLSESTRILLVGACDPKLLDALWSVVNGRGYLHLGMTEKPRGSIDVLDPDIDLSFLTSLEKREFRIPEILPPDESDHSEDYSLSIATEFDRKRHRQMEEAFKKRPIVCILGHTGSGKSYFMRSYPGVIVGDIARWIIEGGTLFLDEANLIKMQWSQFASLLWDTPCIFYQGEYHVLTDKHQIAVAMNPSGYSAERQTPQLLEDYAELVTFSSFPNAYLYHKFLLPILDDCQGNELLIGQLFITTYRMIKDIDDEACSVRELEAMAYNYKALPDVSPDDVQSSALYHACNVANSVLNPEQQSRFYAAFIDKWHRYPQAHLTYPDSIAWGAERFDLMPSQHEAYATLEVFMAASEYKKRMMKTGGMCCFVLEGPAGTAKSLLLRLYLLNKGLKQDQDFYYIPAKWSPTRKKTALLTAFHAGKKVIMDEFNVSEMIEDVLNAVLSGVDMMGRPADTPGFALFGTQNKRAHVASLAVQRRFIRTQFSAYTLQDMYSILVKQGISIPIAYDSVMRQSSSSFRHVWKLAKRRQAHMTEESISPTVSLPKVLWQLLDIFTPLNMADAVLLRTMQQYGWKNVFYQGEDQQFYFHDTVYRDFKKYNDSCLLNICVMKNDVAMLRMIFQRITQPKIIIDETILAHIELDSEMPGLAGLQGEQVDRVFGYFAQYVVERGLTDRGITAFLDAVSALRLQCREASTLNDPQTRSTESFQTYCKEYANKIVDARPDQDVFLNGGWINPGSGSSHSMIYRFANGRFYIYNAGAGLAHHEKNSSIHGVRYYPVKAYRLPQPLNKKELINLISSLLLPVLPDHPARTHTDDISDATKLYRTIDNILEHMSAEQILVSSFLHPDVTTKGVMSGACTLSIQQLLNCYLNDPLIYRARILDLKHYAIHDFIRMHPAPRPAYINRLLCLYIENNLKIVATLSAPNQHNTVAKDLRDLKQQIMTEAWLTSSEVVESSSAPTSYQIEWIPEVITSLPDRNRSDIKPLSELMLVERRIVAQGWRPSSSVTGRMLLQMPMLVELERLQTSYQELYVKCYGELQLPHTFVMNLTILHACAQFVPDFSACFHKEIGGFLYGYRHCAYLANHDIELDQILVRLMSEYKYQAIDYDLFICSRYQDFLRRHPDKQCIQRLDDLYAQRYNNNHQPKHMAIREQRLQALYVLLEELDSDGVLKKQSVLDPDLFKPLTDTIQVQMRLENIIVNCFRALLRVPMPDMICPKLVYQHRRIKLMTQLVASCPSQHYFLQGTHAVHEQQYRMPETAPARQVLLADVPKGIIWQAKNRVRIKENEIQLQFNQDNTRVAKLDFFIRELSHLRVVPEFQIVLTIDYFLRTSSHLQDISIQTYIAANIFQPGLLMQYQADLNLKRKWDELIRAGLLACKDPQGELSHSSLVILRMQYYFNRYLRSEERLYTDVATLNSYIEREQRTDILSSLHQYRFLTLVTLRDPSLYALAYTSYVYMQAVGNGQLEQDIAMQDMLERAQCQFKQWLSRAQRLSSQWMEQTLHQYPVLAKTASRGDPLTGKLYRGDLEICPLPLYWKSSPILAEFGVSSEVLCGITPNEQCILLGLPEPFVRILKVGDHWVFHKKWCVADQEDWYEWCPLSLAQVHQFKLARDEQYYPMIKHHLPAWLTDGSTQAFVRINSPKCLLFIQEKQVRYVWQEGNHLDVFHDRQPVGRLLPLPTNNLADLTHFEASQFIVHTVIQEQSYIDFERYGLRLVYDIDSGSIKDSHSQMNLGDKSLSPFAPNVACLTFTRGGKAAMCKLPVQPFYVLTHDIQKVGEYYPLGHDISAYLPIKHLSQLWDHRKVNKKDQPSWQYRGSEKFVTLQIDQGLPKPHNAADALYLAYVYLASHEVEHAWRILQELAEAGGLRGDITELTYLEWILNKLPETDTYSEHAEHRHSVEALAKPRYIACQLKVLALFTQAMQQGKQWTIPEIQVTQHSSANVHYQDIQQQALKTLWTRFREVLANKYAQYQKIECYLPESFLLDAEDERTSLLAYITLAGNEILGSLGYERLLLSLKALLKLEQHLLALKRSRTSTWSEQEEQRLLVIQQTLQTEAIVRKQTTILEMHEIDLQLPDDFSQKMINACYRCSVLCQMINVLSEEEQSTDDTAIVAALSSKISADDLIQYLPNLIRIARGTEEESKNRSMRHVLRHFCMASLRAARFVELQDQDNPIPYLANILYRILENPTCLGSKTVVGWRELIATLQPLSVTPIHVLQAKDVYAEILATSTGMVQDLRSKMLCREPMVTNPVSVETWDIRLPWFDEYLQGVPFTRVGAEQKVGLTMYRAKQNKQRIARTYLQDESQRQALNDQASSHQHTLECILAQKWLGIEALAHRLPHDNAQEQVFLNDLSASMRHFATKQELLRAYLHHDRAEYYAITALTQPEDVDSLHAALHEYMTLSVQCQKMQRLQKAIQDGESSEDIADILIQQSPKNADTNPCLMLFQYLDNKMLWPDQANALQRLLFKDLNRAHRFDDIVEKMMMGKGKSKVITPILAQEKATGDNLVIVEVQRALLHTQHADMNKLSKSLFNQKAHCFEFNRSSDCSSQRLQEIHDYFVQISAKKDYLVTTGESMQALHLKYRELLLTQPTQSKDWPEWRKQVIWAEKIVQLLKNNGDAMIDEVHLGLWHKRKMNYTFGSPEYVDPDMVTYSIQLYSFLQSYPDCELGGHVFIERLLQQADSPIYPYISPELRATVNRYLNNQYVVIPQEICALDPEIRNKLAFFKEQALLLPKTCANKYKEKYGPSKKVKKTAAEQVQAIPYRANNTPSDPNERSRFGNVMETLNYTIQGLLHQGLDERLLCEAIQHWQMQARKMMQENSEAYLQMNDTPLAQALNPLLATAGYTLQTIDVTRERDRENLSNLFDNKSLIFRVLQDCVLPRIAQDQAVLHADSYDHVDLYRTVQGLTGTPWNHKTYKRVKFDESSTWADEGYMQEVMRSKIQSLRAIPFNSLAQFIRALDLNPPTHALIDVCARFAGFDAREVAKELAKHFAERNSKIKYVLYCNEDDVLCALPVSANKPPVILGTSDMAEISRKLDGCAVDECFTYYDQLRAFGLDVTQAKDAKAMILTDDNTYIHKYHQGGFRMRGIEKQQALDLVVPPHLAGMSVDELETKMKIKEAQQIMEDNVIACFDKLDNLVRLELEQKIMGLAATDVDKKHRYMLAFEQFFVDKPDLRDLFDKYGGGYHQAETQAILRRHKQHLLKEWSACLDAVRITPSETERVWLTRKMDLVITESRDICPKTITNRLEKRQHGQEIEDQNELELDLEQCDEYYDTDLVAARTVQWDPNAARPLREWCGRAPNFSDGLLYSPNFAKTYEGQLKKLDKYVKPAHIVYFSMQKGMLTACLVTIEEARQIKNNMPHNRQCWLGTLHHSVIAGQAPEHITEDPAYQSLIEQIRYFNGEVNALIDKRHPCVWLNHDIDNKLAYCDAHILPNREATHIRSDAKSTLQNQAMISASAIEQSIVGGIVNWFGQLW